MSKIEYTDWFDEVDLVHLNRNPDILNSENGPLFTAEFHLLYYLCYGKKHSKLSSSIIAVNPTPHIYKPSGAGGEHFSHDNMTGLYCMYNLALSRIPKHLPLTTKYVKHPRDILFFMFAKIAHKKDIISTIVKHILLIIPSIAMIVSCYQLYKTRHGNKILKTDGKLLTWLRCKSFNLKKTYACATWIMKFKGRWSGWNEIFAYYFHSHAHPNIEMSEKLYNRGF